MLDQQRDVRGALTQGRHHQLHHVEAIVEILAESLALHRFLQVGVGRRDDPDVDLDGARAADPLHLALLERA